MVLALFIVLFVEIYNGAVVALLRYFSAGHFYKE